MKRANEKRLQKLAEQFVRAILEEKETDGQHLLVTGYHVHVGPYRYFVSVTDQTDDATPPSE